MAMVKPHFYFLENRPYLGGSAASHAIRNVSPSARAWWLGRLWRCWVPRMLQVTIVWLLIFTATGVGWHYILDQMDDIQEEQYMVTAFYTLLVIVVGFALVQDWTLGTTRFQTGGRNEAYILDITTRITYKLIDSIRHSKKAHSPENAAKIASYLLHIECVLRALPYVVWIYFRDIRLDVTVRRANLLTLLRAIIPAEVISKGIEERITNQALNKVPLILLYEIHNKLIPIETMGLLTVQDQGILREALSDMGTKISELNASIVVTYPRGGADFITVAVVIFLFFLPVLLFFGTLWKMLVLNGLIVFLFSGSLEIGRFFREPYEDMYINPYSDLPIVGWCNTCARDNDMLFDHAIATFERRSHGVAALDNIRLSDYALSSVTDFEVNGNTFRREHFSDERYGPAATLLNGVENRLNLCTLDRDGGGAEDYINAPFHINFGGEHK